MNIAVCVDLPIPKYVVSITTHYKCVSTGQNHEEHFKLAHYPIVKPRSSACAPSMDMEVALALATQR